MFDNIYISIYIVKHRVYIIVLRKVGILTQLSDSRNRTSKCLCEKLESLGQNGNHITSTIYNDERMQDGYIYEKVLQLHDCIIITNWKDDCMIFTLYNIHKLERNNMLRDEIIIMRRRTRPGIFVNFALCFMFRQEKFYFFFSKRIKISNQNLNILLLIDFAINGNILEHIYLHINLQVCTFLIIWSK